MRSAGSRPTRIFGRRNLNGVRNHRHSRRPLSARSPLDLGEIDAERCERRRHLGRAPQIGDRVAQQPADEKLQAEIIDPLCPRSMCLSGRGHPAIDDIVAHRQDGRGEPVVRPRGAGILADTVDQRVEDRSGEQIVFGGRRRGGGGHGQSISLVTRHPSVTPTPGHSSLCVVRAAGASAAHHESLPAAQARLPLPQS